MKKLLIASAALAMVAGTAQAQSSVQVYGILDIGVSEASQEVTAANGTSVKGTRSSSGNGDGALSTSRLGFRGTEDLGGGKKANFVLEYDLVNVGAGANGNNDGQANGFGARYSWVGLEDAKLGQLRLGRQESSAHSVVVGGSAGMANNVAGAMYSGNQAPDMANAISVRPHAVFVDRAVTYISPKLGNVTAEVQMAKLKDKQSSPVAADNASDTSTIYGASLKYAAGPLSLAYAYQQIKRNDSLVGVTAMGSAAAGASDNTNQNGKAHMFAGSYDLGVAKLFAMHAQQKQNDSRITTGARVDNAKGETTEIGVQVPMGKTLLWASMFEGTDKTTTNPAVPLDFDTKGYQLGARYDLSKRTNLYAIYGTQEAKGTAIANRGVKAEATGMAFGVRHSF
jgi:predicted porin